MMPSQTTFGLLWAGWLKLARRYPDQGSLADVAWHSALCWRNHKAFMALVSANEQGVRVAISCSAFAMFFPWSEVAVSAKRGWFTTLIYLRPREVSDTELAIEADDHVADDLLRPTGISLAPRKCKWAYQVCMGIGLAAVLAEVMALLLLRH
jgi:hypothetical protein